MQLGARVMILTLLASSVIGVALARDNGQWANQPADIREWFNGLHSQGHGPCCSFADGLSIEDPDWRITTAGTYQVYYQQKWRDVPPDAVVKGANRVGHAVLWPVQFGGGAVITIRCFLPGSET
jgi:hypothetical protein